MSTEQTELAPVTTAARRLCRELNSARVEPGWIYAIDLAAGRVLYLVGSYAATQPPRELRERNRVCFARVSYGRTTERECQTMIDTLGDNQ